MGVLAQQLGLQIATLWALSSDGAFFVAQASGGPRRHALRPGAAAPAALGDRQANSLQRVQASKTATVYTAVLDAATGTLVDLSGPGHGAGPGGPSQAQVPAAGGGAGPPSGGQVAVSAVPGPASAGAAAGGGGGPPSSGPGFGRVSGAAGGYGGGCVPASALPHDLAELAAAARATDFAVLPLMSGGEVVGAVTLALHRSHLPPQKRQRSSRSASTTSKSRAQKQLEEHQAAAAAVAVVAAAAEPAAAAAEQPAGTPRGAARGVLAGVLGSGGGGGVGSTDKSATSLPERIRRALSRGDGSGSVTGSAGAAAPAGSKDAESVTSSVAVTSGRAAANSGSVANGGAGSAAGGGAGRAPLPPTCWLQSAACLYQLSQLAHFLGYGFFSDSEQGSFVAQSCSLVSGVASAPDVQTLVNCLIGMTKSLIYHRFRLQAQCLVALVHNSGNTAAFFKQSRGMGGRGGGSRIMMGGVGGGSGAVGGGRTLSQRDMSHTRLPSYGTPYGGGAYGTGGGGTGHGMTVGPGYGGGAGSEAHASPSYAALMAANGSAGGAAGNAAASAGGAAGAAAAAAAAAASLSAMLLGRKTRSQSQLKMARSMPLHDAEGGLLAGYGSETMGTSVTATVISLSRTLLHEALRSAPPAGTAVRNTADAIARDSAPIRDLSLACRLCEPARWGPGHLGEDSVSNSGAYAGAGGGLGGSSFSHGHGGPLASPSCLRRSTAGRAAPLGSLVIALGMGAASVGSAAAGAATGTGCGSMYGGGYGSGHVVGAGASSRLSLERSGAGYGGEGQSGGGGGAFPGLGPAAAAHAQAQAAAAAAGAGEPFLALYVAFREVLQESALERVLEEMTQVVELVTPSVQRRLLMELRPEWAAMATRLLAPAAFIGGQSVLSATGGLGPGLGLGLGLPAGLAGAAAALTGNSHSRRGLQPGLHDWIGPEEALGNTEALWPASPNLSFALEDPAPLSHLQVMVNSLHSTLSSIQVERAVDEAGDSPSQANDMRGLELLQQVGRGGQGVVYRGRLHGIPVAVKVIPTAEGGGGMGPVDRDVAFDPPSPRGGGMGPVDRDVAFDADNADAARRAARRQRALLRDALEVAATAAVSHPNLVQLHTYFNDVMVVEYEGDEGRFRLMHVADTAPGDPTGAINLVLVLEYCDGGNLRQAMERGVFFRRGGASPPPSALPAARAEAAGAGGAAAALAAAAELQPNFEFIYLTLLEVALALRHMHAMRLVHCDVKPSNVLLRAAPHDPRGFTCKLSDFGCVQMLRDVPAPAPPAPATPPQPNGPIAATPVDPQAASTGGVAAAAAAALGGGTAAGGGAAAGGGGGGGLSRWGTSLSGTSEAGAGAGARMGFMSGHVLGTPSHLAPEAFLPGTLLDASVDVYSFGMLMWEVLVGIPALAGLSAARVHSYTSRGLRPQFPTTTPDHYRALAHACWAQDPRRRPTASGLVVSLHKALMQVSPGTALDVGPMLAAEASPPPPPPHHHGGNAWSAAASPSAAGGGGGRMPWGGPGGAGGRAHPGPGRAPYGRMPTSPDVGGPGSDHPVSPGPGGLRQLNRPSSLGRATSRQASAAAAAAAAAAVAAADREAAAGVPISLPASLLLNRRRSISERRRSMSAFHSAHGLHAQAAVAAAAAAAAEAAGGAAAAGGGAAAATAASRGSICGGGSSPLLQQLAQSRMSRSSRVGFPGALQSPGSAHPASYTSPNHASVPPTLASAYASAPGGESSSPAGGSGAAAVNSGRGGSTSQLVLGAAEMGDSGGALAEAAAGPAAPPRGRQAGPGPMLSHPPGPGLSYLARGASPPRVGSNGSISFGASGGTNGGGAAAAGQPPSGGGGGGVYGGGSSPTGANLVHDACLATAADMAEIALGGASGASGGGGGGGGLTGGMTDSRSISVTGGAFGGGSSHGGAASLRGSAAGPAGSSVQLSVQAQQAAYALQRPQRQGGPGLGPLGPGLVSGAGPGLAESGVGSDATFHSAGGLSAPMSGGIVIGSGGGADSHGGGGESGSETATEKLAALLLPAGLSSGTHDS
ncbi:hypothetical protein HYH03_017220 [Edaphochlamys debaryana]|uniref:Protein kinase domain-containing protein n=1 Tax=Edaphochlamys debaryana TaxID=47281 RepID=A0A835XHN1_9CHLO|nr:hypothetical protein HYH03_017220 [Edaphochlamys debaryana]|eukprot:KAG2483976.1 hypothetical protein HYH03_017220 [Edaphochlamys debaryana]